MLVPALRAHRFKLRLYYDDISKLKLNMQLVFCLRSLGRFHELMRLVDKENSQYFHVYFFKFRLYILTHKAISIEGFVICLSCGNLLL